MHSSVHHVGIGGHPKVAPEEAGERMKRSSALVDGSHHGHVHGAAHFQDIDNRLGATLEADAPGDSGVPGGADAVDETRFHGAHLTPHVPIFTERAVRASEERTRSSP